MLGYLTVSAAAAVAPRVLRRVPPAKLRPGWYAHVLRLVAGLACCYEKESSRPQAAEQVLRPMLYTFSSPYPPPPASSSQRAS